MLNDAEFGEISVLRPTHYFSFNLYFGYTLKIKPSA